MKVNIFFNGKLVVDVWRDERGNVCSLGHDIEPRAAIPAKAHAVRVMRDRLGERGDDLRKIDADLERFNQPGVHPATQNQILTDAVYVMGELLCSQGEDAFDVEIGQAVN